MLFDLDFTYENKTHIGIYNCLISTTVSTFMDFLVHISIPKTDDQLKFVCLFYTFLSPFKCCQKASPPA